MSDPRIIVFAGLVGAGKSTQMKLLASKLKTRGLRVKTTFLKTGHLFAYLLEVTLARMLASNRRDVYPVRALIQEKPRLFKKLFKLWLFLDALSISTRFLITIYLPSRIHRIVIVEEYIPATIADYVYLAKAVGFPLEELAPTVSFMLRLLSLGGSFRTVFLDVRDDVLGERWERRASLDEKPDYLRMQRILLLFIAKKFSSSFLYIDATHKTIREVHELVMHHVMAQYKIG
jgi:thymidylate kinase